MFRCSSFSAIISLDFERFFFVDFIWKIIQLDVLMVRKFSMKRSKRKPTLASQKIHERKTHQFRNQSQVIFRWVEKQSYEFRSEIIAFIFHMFKYTFAIDIRVFSNLTINYHERKIFYLNVKVLANCDEFYIRNIQR